MGVMSWVGEGRGFEMLAGCIGVEVLVMKHEDDFFFTGGLDGWIEWSLSIYAAGDREVKKDRSIFKL